MGKAKSIPLRSISIPLRSKSIPLRSQKDTTGKEKDTTAKEKIRNQRLRIEISYTYMKQEIVRTSKESARDVSIYNVRQKKCWALAVEQLQPYLSKHVDWETISKEELSKIIPLDKDYLYRCELPIQEISNGHKVQTLEDILEMGKIKISGVNGDGDQYSIFFMYGVVQDSETGKIYGLLPLQSLRWLLNFGQKQMFVAFHKPSFLRLSSSYSMDLFLLLSENYNRGEFIISLENFKKRMNCPETYDAQAVQHRIIEPALAEYKRKGSALSCVCEFFSSEVIRQMPGRRRLNMLKFTVLKVEDGKYYKSNE